MFNLPDYPDVYTTRHITCVSCKEKFAVTEGNQSLRTQDNRWRVLSNETSNISLRQEDNRQQRPVVPQPFQIPAEAESSAFLQQRPVPFTPVPIHCPRCGADNRNWLVLQNTNLLGSWRTFSKRFPLSSYALLLAALFAFLALLIPMYWLKVLSLVVSIPLAVWLLNLDLTSKWNKLRESRHVAKVKDDAPDVERQLWTRGFAWLFLASFALPLLIFALLPRVALFALEIVGPTPEEEVDKVTTAVYEMVNQNFATTAESLEETAGDMNDLLDEMPTGASPQFEEEVNSFSEKLSQIIQAALTELDRAQQEASVIIDEQQAREVRKITQARETALEQFAKGLLGDFRFLLIWAVMMGLPLFFSVFLIMGSIKKFVSAVDQQLPPPIFCSVAGMTRVVSWEAKQALEIEGTMHHIQWVNVERNTAGGINLMGLHRDPPNFDAYGRAIGELVRAQKHVVETDMWGRIIKATIHDTRVPRPAGGPEYVSVFPLPHDAPVSVRPPNR